MTRWIIEPETNGRFSVTNGRATVVRDASSTKVRDVIAGSLDPKDKVFERDPEDGYLVDVTTRFRRRKGWRQT